MGLDLLSILKSKVSQKQKIAFIGTFVVALLVHLYKFTNTMPTHDSLCNYYSDQNIVGSGRWALSVACGFSSYFDLPWVNGLMSCFFLAMTAVVLVSLFKMENPVLIVLTGGLLAASPSTTETFFFLFTADGYMISMFLAALAVYWSRMEEKRVSRWILSSVCICLSCGIYQAYVSFALLLAVCHFMYELFQNNYDKKSCWIWIGRQACIFVCALAAYYGIWRLCLCVQNSPAYDYQGMSGAGAIGMDTLLNGAASAVQSVLIYFLQWNVLEQGITLYGVLNLIAVLFFVIGLIIAVKESKILSRCWAFVFVMLCLVAIVPFACIWSFVSNTVAYRPMMLQSLVVPFVLTAMLAERWGKQYFKNIVGIVLLVIVLNNAITANISYFYMNLSYERTYADGLEMVMEIHDLQQQHKIEKIAFIGDRLEDVQWGTDQIESKLIDQSEKIYMLSSLLESNLLFNHAQTVLFLNANYGLEIPSASFAERIALAQNETVIDMPCWPQDEAMRVIDGTLVIKLADIP